MSGYHGFIQFVFNYSTLNEQQIFFPSVNLCMVGENASWSKSPQKFSFKNHWPIEKYIFLLPQNLRSFSVLILACVEKRLFIRYDTFRNVPFSTTSRMWL